MTIEILYDITVLARKPRGNTQFPSEKFHLALLRDAEPAFSEVWHAAKYLLSGEGSVIGGELWEFKGLALNAEERDEVVGRTPEVLRRAGFTIQGNVRVGPRDA